MRLYSSLGPNPGIVRTFAAEKAVELELVPVDIMGGENRGAAFKAINPMGQLPALELASGQVVTEITAICELIEELHPQPALIGNDAPERAETRMWARRIDNMVIEPYHGAFHATSARAFFEPRIPILSESAGAEMMGLLDGNMRDLDGLLAGRSWIVGERFSMADIFLGHFLLHRLAYVGPLPDGLAWMPAFVERCQARASFAA